MKTTSIRVLQRGRVYRQWLVVLGSVRWSLADRVLANSLLSVGCALALSLPVLGALYV